MGGCFFKILNVWKNMPCQKPILYVIIMPFPLDEAKLNFKYFEWFVSHVYSLKPIVKKNPACGRHQIFWPMRIIAPIFFVGKKNIYLIRKDSLFLGLYESVNKCTSRTPLTRGPFTGAIWNHSLFLRLYESIDKCSSPLVEHLPRVANPCMQSRITPRF